MKEIIYGINADLLKAIARKLGLPKKITRKGELVSALLIHLENDLQGFLDTISPLEKNLVAEAVYNNGTIDAPLFNAKYGAKCPLPYRRGRPDEASPLLLVIDQEDGKSFIPGEIAARFRAILERPGEDTIKFVNKIPSIYKPPKQRWRNGGSERPINLFEGQKSVFTEMRRVLKLVQAGRIRITPKSKRPTGASVKTISGALMLPDFDVESPEKSTYRHYKAGGAIRAHAWGVLSQQCGWCKPERGKLTLTSAGKNILGALDIQQFREGIDNFFNDDMFDEFNRIPNIRGQSGGASGHMTFPSERKISIAESMREWPVDKWIPFDEAFRFAYSSGNGFQVSSEPMSLYFSEFQYGHLAQHGMDVNRVYLRALFFESLATLGLVDIAYAHPHRLWPEFYGCWGRDDMLFCSRYDGLLHIKLNALGAYCLEITGSYEAPLPEKQGLFKILPNLELVLVCDRDVPEAERCTIDIYAKKKSDHTWKIDSHRILSHIESGGSIKDVTDFLEGNAVNEIPQNVKIFLEDIASRIHSIKGVEDAMLVEVDDSATAALIAHDSGTGRYCKLAGDLHLVVPRKNQRAFYNALKKLGYIIPA